MQLEAGVQSPDCSAAVLQCCSVQYYRYCTFLLARNLVITLAFFGVVLSQAVRPGNQALVDLFQALRNYVVCLFLCTYSYKEAKVMRTKYQTNKMTPYLWSIFQLLK